MGKIVLKANIDLNARDIDGCTASMIAYQNGDNDVVKKYAS